ncbi:hypothetical protein ACQB60_09315 [Actinomycetota bacterium Odt1-20B]
MSKTRRTVLTVATVGALGAAIAAPSAAFAADQGSGHDARSPYVAVDSAGHVTHPKSMPKGGVPALKQATSPKDDSSRQHSDKDARENAGGLVATDAAGHITHPKSMPEGGVPASTRG